MNSRCTTDKRERKEDQREDTQRRRKNNNNMDITIKKREPEVRKHPGCFLFFDT
jgi:hypothetical protein